MKPLFDHNLSPSLVRSLADLFPEASRVAMLGLDRATDPQVIDVALAGGYPIVTKDGDFSDLSLVRGLSPQGVWLRIGNCTTDEIEALIRAHFGAITEFEAEGTAGTLELLLH